MVQHMLQNMVTSVMAEHMKASCLIGNQVKRYILLDIVWWPNDTLDGTFLRNGNQEEIDYQRQYGGTVSDLFKGGQDNMVSTITTLERLIMAHLLQIN